MIGVKFPVMHFAYLFLFIVYIFSGSTAEAIAPAVDDSSDTLLLRARVTNVEEREPEEHLKDFVDLEQVVTVAITGGAYRGQERTFINSIMGHPYFDLHLTEGRRVVLWGEIDEDGNLQEVFLQDFEREGYLYFLGILFIMLLLAVGKRKGLATILTLGVTIFAVFRVLLPMLLAGYSPIGATIAVASFVTLFTIVFISGLHKKTLAAAVGTVGGVLVAGILALLIGNVANLTGFSSDEAQMLWHMEEAALDVRGLLFAGIIIGALGAVMDVSVSISTAIFEVHCANPALSLKALIRSGMNVGRDIMGTMSNTLILAYVGTAIPLLLLFIGYETPWMVIINSDLVSTEIVRALAGTIGLVACIPLTAVTSGLLLVRTQQRCDASQKKSL